MATLQNADTNRILNLVCGKIHEMRKKELNYEEVCYVMSKIKNLDLGIFNGRKLSDVVPVMAKIYLDDLKKLEKYQAEDGIDMHEYLVNNIN